MGNPRRSGGGSEEALHAAARAGDLQAVQSICISNPLAVNSRDKHSRTPFKSRNSLFACEGKMLHHHRRCRRAKALAKAGSRVGKMYAVLPPLLERLFRYLCLERLHLAAWSGQTAVVTYLCKNRADVGAAAMDDMGAIHFATQKGHLEVVRTLVLSGVSIKAPNRKGLTPLHFAAQGSNLELVKYLVKKGASVTTQTKAGKTPLDLAKKDEIVSFLEECQQPSKKGEGSSSKANSEELNFEPSTEDNAASFRDETVTKPKEEQEEDSKDEKMKGRSEDQDSMDDDSKRKGDEDKIDDNLSKPKKARVALNHLLAADDTEEEKECV